MLAIITVAFFMMRAAPGSPYSTERKLTPAVEANLKAHMGLDKPLHEQYFEYLGNVVQGDLGPSMQISDKSVSELLGDVVQSWVSTGQNLPVSADQLQSALGVDRIDALEREREGLYASLADPAAPPVTYVTIASNSFSLIAPTALWTKLRSTFLLLT